MRAIPHLPGPRPTSTLAVQDPFHFGGTGTSTIRPVRQLRADHGRHGSGLIHPVDQQS